MLRDTNLEILAFSSMSLQACHQGRPRDGLDLARAAQERAARIGSPVLQSLIAAREARALTLLGDGTPAGKRLADAIRLIDCKAHGRPSPDWAAFHGPAELEYFQALMYAELGSHGRAAQFLRAALIHQETSYGRNRALYRLTLAKALVDAGEVDEAAEHAVKSLEHLEEVESGRVARKLREITGALRGIDADSARQTVATLDEHAHTRGAAQWQS
ncbi:hypothetical protein ACFRI7_32005 [Streptomyces sp. NPDC056716]|uniref:hypothetical protein n=1 Tax=unclassified Streptomyces TaxID=2593676 RepID=UPI0036C27330